MTSKLKYAERMEEYIKKNEIGFDKDEDI